MPEVYNWQIGRSMSYPYEEKRPPRSRPVHNCGRHLSPVEKPTSGCLTTPITAAAHRAGSRFRVRTDFGVGRSPRQRGPFLRLHGGST